VQLKSGDIIEFNTLERFGKLGTYFIAEILTIEKLSIKYAIVFEIITVLYSDRMLTATSRPIYHLSVPNIEKYIKVVDGKAVKILFANIEKSDTE